MRNDITWSFANRFFAIGIFFVGCFDLLSVSLVDYFIGDLDPYILLSILIAEFSVLILITEKKLQHGKF